MEPTCHTGDKVYVWKPIIGSRIYTDFNFDEGNTLKCIRLPGIRRLQVGDKAVINNPYGWGWGRIAFRINHVYLKRCAACPGDTVSIVNSHYVNSRTGDIGLPLESEARLRNTSDSVLLQGKALKAGQFAGETAWTIKDFGPLPIPGKGTSVVLDSLSVCRYAKILEYELNSAVVADGTSYTFKHDYYFFVGDNVVDSRDSRYFGFVPDDFVVGVVF